MNTIFLRTFHQKISYYLFEKSIFCYCKHFTTIYTFFLLKKKKKRDRKILLIIIIFFFLINNEDIKLNIKIIYNN